MIKNKRGKGSKEARMSRENQGKRNSLASNAKSESQLEGGGEKKRRLGQGM